MSDNIDRQMKEAQTYTYAGPLLEALVKKLEGEIAIAVANPFVAPVDDVKTSLPSTAITPALALVNVVSEF